MKMVGRRLVRRVFVAVPGLCACSGSAGAQIPAPAMRGDGPSPAPRPFSITRAASGLDAVVDPDTTAEPIARGFGLNEGPVWVREGTTGYLVVSGLMDNVLYKVAADKTVSVLLEIGSAARCWASCLGRRPTGPRAEIYLSPSMSFLNRGSSRRLS